MRRFLTNISRFGIFVEKIVCFTRFFSAPHWYISSRQKIKIGANIICISLNKMISPFISGYNLVENPLIFTTKTIDSVLCDNEHKMNGKDQEMKWDRLYSTFRLEGSDLWLMSNRKIPILESWKKIESDFYRLKTSKRLRSFLNIFCQPLITSLMAAKAFKKQGQAQSLTRISQLEDWRIFQYWWH